MTTSIVFANTTHTLFIQTLRIKCRPMHLSEKQFSPRSGPKNVEPDLDPTYLEFKKEFFEIDEFEKNQHTTEGMKNYSAPKE